MYLKNMIIALLIMSSVEVAAQSFSYIPEKPQAGQTITVSYTPSGLLAGTSGPVNLIYYTSRKSGIYAFDGTFNKKGNMYVATIPTDTADLLVMLRISSENNIDNNNGEGYLIPLYKGEMLQKGVDFSMGEFYNNLGRNMGIDPVPEKALNYMDEEFEKYPEEKNSNRILTYLRVYKVVHPEKGDKEVQKTIEALLKAGMKDEDDYTRLQSLYALNKLTQQSNFIKKMIEDKFPDGKWKINQTLQRFMAEKDPAKKAAMWQDISSKIDNDPDWINLQSSKTFFQGTLLTPFFNHKDWNGLEAAVMKYNISGAALASEYNNTAWQMQEKDQDLQQCLKMSTYATEWAKNQIDHPEGQKPDYLTESQWKTSRENTYATYADTYAMVQYKLGNYKKGFPYAEDAALKINKGESADLNNTYALLASKVLSPKKFVPVLEKMVKDGKSTSAMKDILKEEYIRKHGEGGYKNYMAALEKASMEKMLAELKKSMLNDQSPSFALKDMNGDKVNVADLKGKVLVLDFWATWCGPCKASFPAMQKMVTKYKDDPSVKFLFVDTWENGESKEKNAKEFITANKYDFHVLMDNDNKVVEQFKVNGIPTKFVIDKNGVIRFKSVGFNGSDDGLVNELSAMIDIAKGA